MKDIGRQALTVDALKNDGTGRDPTSAVEQAKAGFARAAYSAYKLLPQTEFFWGRSLFRRVSVYSHLRVTQFLGTFTAKASSGSSACHAPAVGAGWLASNGSPEAYEQEAVIATGIFLLGENCRPVDRTAQEDQ